MEKVRRPFSLEWWVPPLIFGLAAMIRVFEVGMVHPLLDDTRLHAISDVTYSRFGLLGPDAWWTPPLKHLLMYLSIGVFGNHLAAWQMREVFSGSLAVVVVFLIARQIFGKPYPAIAAAVLFALDPLSLTASMNTMEDMTATCLMLLSIFFCVRALQYDKEWDRAAAGVFAGLAGATRLWAFAPVPVMLAVVLWHERGRVGAILRDLAHFVIGPVTIFILTYLPWFARGNSVTDFVSLQLDGLSFEKAVGTKYFSADSLALSGPRRWMVSLVAAGTRHAAGTGQSKTIVMMNDPVLWVLFAPAVIYLLWISLKGRKPTGVLIAGTFLLLYGFFLSAPRGIVLYSATGLVPLGFIAVAFAAQRLWRDRAWWFLGGATAWSLYLMPLVLGMTATGSGYGWLLRMMKVS